MLFMVSVHLLNILSIFQDTNNEYLEKLVKPYCIMFDLCGPMRGCTTAQERHLFMEGDLRYKDSSTKVCISRFSSTIIICS